MLRGANSQHTDTSYQWVWSNHPTAPVVPPSARSAQGGTRRQTTARRHRGLPPAERARQGAVEQACTQPAITRCRQLCGSESSLASAEHRTRLSGRRTLSERPPSRVSRCHSRAASRSAGPERWPAGHDPPIVPAREKEVSNFFRGLIIYIIGMLVYNHLETSPSECAMCFSLTFEAGGG